MNSGMRENVAGPGSLRRTSKPMNVRLLRDLWSPSRQPAEISSSWSVADHFLCSLRWSHTGESGWETWPEGPGRGSSTAARRARAEHARCDAT
eukprot:3328929-Rhodomonas_salina.2